MSGVAVRKRVERAVRLAPRKEEEEGSLCVKRYRYTVTKYDRHSSPHLLLQYSLDLLFHCLHQQTVDTAMADRLQQPTVEEVATSLREEANEEREQADSSVTLKGGRGGG